MEQFSDKELIAEFRRGTWEAANTLFQRYQEKFFNLAFYLNGDAEVAEDMVTINASKIFYAIQKGDDIDFSFSMYQGIIQEVVEKQNGEVTASLEVETLSNTESDRLEFLASTLLSVPFENRAVFVVREFLELSKNECCKVLKISEKDFQLRLRRTQRILSRVLKKEGGAVKEQQVSVTTTEDESPYQIRGY